MYCYTSGYNVYDLSFDFAAGVWGGVQCSLSQPGRGTRGHSPHSSPCQAHLVRLPQPHALKCPSFTGPPVFLHVSRSSMGFIFSEHKSVDFCPFLWCWNALQSWWVSIVVHCGGQHWFLPQAKFRWGEGMEQIQLHLLAPVRGWRVGRARRGLAYYDVRSKPKHSDRSSSRLLFYQHASFFQMSLC